MVAQLDSLSNMAVTAMAGLVNISTGLSLPPKTGLPRPGSGRQNSWQCQLGITLDNTIAEERAVAAPTRQQYAAAITYSSTRQP